MLLYHIALLALVQGIAEFLPISSSGHLILLHDLLDSEALRSAENNRLMDIAVHIGSLFAVLVYFHKDVARMVKGFFALSAYPRDKVLSEESRLMVNVLVGSLPILLIGGIVFTVLDPKIFYNPKIIAYTTVIFGLLMGFADAKGAKSRAVEQMTWKDALLIGFAQCLALIPGVSRSGITMTSSRLLGFIRPETARYSMLLSIIATSAVGAMGILDLFQEGRGGLISDALIAAGLTFAVALVVIVFLMEWLKRFSLVPFVVYRLILGAALFYFFILPDL